MIGSGGEDNPVSSAMLRNLTSGGFAGEVFVVDDSCDQIQGLRTYPRVSELPSTVDLALFCGSAAEVPGVVRECGQSGVGGLLVTSGGFREAGPAGLELQRRILHESARYRGLRPARSAQHRTTGAAFEAQREPRTGPPETRPRCLRFTKRNLVHLGFGFRDGTTNRFFPTSSRSATRWN